jgi:hypothetical protein
MRDVTARLVPGRGHYLVLKPFALTRYAAEFWRNLEASGAWATTPASSETPPPTTLHAPHGQGRAAAS